ncbi:MAG TPA: Hpt domain-containing protein, partial [Polyangiaceae bacterium]|nr:Hpt domain-containing protein [Polyangiaceae bacterium]
ASAPARAAHTLRGTAANIGASALSRAAAALEQACLSGPDSDGKSEALGAVERELVCVLESLRQLDAPAPGASEPQRAVPIGRVAQLVEQLEQRLTASDASSLELLAELEPLLEGDPALRARLNPALLKVHEFDFDAALKLLQGLELPHEACTAVS